MQNNDIPLPEAEKISKLIDALRDCAVKRDRAAYWEEHLREIYNALYVASRDDFAWFELLSQDWEVADFLISDTDKRAAIDKEPSIVRSAVRTDRD